MEEAGNTLLTDAELELMLILWKLEEGSVHEVLAIASGRRKIAYTTVSTIIRILEKKGFVSSRKQGKAHIYSPLLTKKEYQGRTLGNVVETLFDNTPVSLFARMIDDKRLSAEEIAEIKKLLEERGQASE